MHHHVAPFVVVGMVGFFPTAGRALALGSSPKLMGPATRGRASVAMTASDGANNFGERASDAIDGFAKLLVQPKDAAESEENRLVRLSLDRMQRDFQMLDNAADAAPKLGQGETLILSATVLAAFTSPYFLTAKVVEVLVPSMAALSASIGFSAEYLGKVAVSRGKEIAATTLMAAAEAELYLAQAERSKAIIPLCVGIATTASAFALLAPALLAELATRGLGVQVITEIYLICPLFAVLAAAVAALAAQETSTLSSRAIGLGARRFASGEEVGRTWLSATEQINESVDRSQQKFLSFTLGVLPAPVLAVLTPGSLAFRAIVAAAVAAAQTAYSLARAEYTLAAAVESVALKSRSAAVTDTYANQGARAGAILPFTSALSGLCAAVTVALVEYLPVVGNVAGAAGESVVCVIFPGLGALIAAAASVSKARCELDASAAEAASTKLSAAGVDGLDTKNPVGATYTLVKLTVKGLVQNARSKLKSAPRSWIDWLVARWRALLGKGGGGGAEALSTA